MRSRAGKVGALTPSLYFKDTQAMRASRGRCSQSWRPTASRCYGRSGGSSRRSKAAVSNTVRRGYVKPDTFWLASPVQQADAQQSEKIHFACLLIAPSSLSSTALGMLLLCRPDNQVPGLKLGPEEEEEESRWEVRPSHLRPIK